MSLSKSKFWYSDNCLHFLKHAVQLGNVKTLLVKLTINNLQHCLFLHKMICPLSDSSGYKWYKGRDAQTK
jgi:hypothetical protein